GAPHVKAVRGVSDFGASFVYVVFEDGTDIYWARSRTMEYLSAALSRLPQGVKTELGPDATGLGWVYQYALVDESGTHSLADIRSYQDWYLRYHLKSVRGVADVASVGGYVRQYQVNIDPNRLRARGIPLAKVVEAVRGGNDEAGGRLIEVSGTEYMVPGRADPDQGHRPGGGRPRHPPRHRRSRRPRRSGLGHRHHAPRRERARGDRARAREAGGGEGRTAARHQGRPDLRPGRADPALGRQPEVDAPRDHGHRRPGDHAV